MEVYGAADKETGTVCLRVSKVVISGLQSCKRALLWNHCVCVRGMHVFFFYDTNTHRAWSVSVGQMFTF